MSRARPLAEAERRVSRLEAEAKALAKMIDVEAKKLWPPAIDLLTVEKGYEAALGAALGDDLEAPVDPASPMRWAGAARRRRRSGAAGRRRAARRATSRRRPSWRGGWRRSASSIARSAPTLVAQLKPGQRLVSREGDLWRWDGFAAAANAPTAAARRLAAKNRLADLDAELDDRAHRRRRASAALVEAAEAELTAAVAAEDRGAQRAPRGAGAAPTRRATRMRRPSARPTA